MRPSQLVSITSALAAALVSPPSSPLRVSQGRAPWVVASSKGETPLAEYLRVPSREVVEAVSRSGRRVTAGDVATAAGLSVDEARSELVSLAAALGSPLEVSIDGEVVYVFPADVPGALSRASATARARQLFDRLKPVLVTSARVAFGVALFVSLAVIFSAIAVISTSSRDDDSERRQGGPAYSSNGGGLILNLGGPSPLDLFYYRPYYVPDPSERMNFLEAVFSLVFGDGDPNYDRERTVVAAVAATARANGGVLIADQIAPLMDPPLRDDSELVVDESFVLPVLTKLNGMPEVAQDGSIVYVFPDELMTTTSRSVEPPAILEEAPIPFSNAKPDQLLLAGLLGLVNLVGVAYLGFEFLSLPPGLHYTGFLGAVQDAFPALAAYAATFVTAPVIRKFAIDNKNAKASKRNTARRNWLRDLQQGRANDKLQVAATFRRRMTTVSKEDIIFDTSNPENSAKTMAEDDFRNFDDRLTTRS